MNQLVSNLSRRSFLKSLGIGAATLTLGSAIGPWVHGQETFTLGMANPLATFFGQAAEKALRLRIEEINANGGILGRQMQLAISDSAGRPDQALRAVQELVLSKGADVMTGFFFSEELLGALPAIGGLGKIFLGTGAATPSATAGFVQPDYDTFKVFFRVGPINSFFIVQNMANFIRDFVEGQLGLTKAVLLAEDAAWTTAITDGMPAILAAFGSQVQIVDTIRYAEDTADFSSIFSRAVASGADHILTLMAHTGLRPTDQWAKAQVPLPLIGINVQAQDGNFDSLSNGGAESVVTFATGAKAAITDKTLPFVEAFENFTSFLPNLVIPSYNAFVSSDALDVLIDSVERAGVLPDTTANRDKVISAMEATDIVGTTGVISFYQLNETGVSPLRPDLAFPHDVRFGPDQSGVWIQWQDGNLKTLFPSNLATADFVKPPWLR